MTGMTTRTWRSKRWLSAMAGAALVFAGAGVAAVSDQPSARRTASPVAEAAPAGPVSVAEWSRTVWSGAARGDETQVLRLLDRLPADHEDEAVRALRVSVDQFKSHLSQSGEQRAKRIEEVREELRKHAEANALNKALVSAIELVTISKDREAVLKDEVVVGVVNAAEARAADAESKGEWLDAHALFFRLGVLYDEEGRHKKDVARLGDRIALMATYVPERLHALRNEQRVREGEEPLPAYNALGDDWRKKVSGIDQFIVRRALTRAQQSHVDRTTMARMITGGLQSLRTLITTPDLAAAFPGLADAGARARLLAEVDAKIESFAAPREKDADSFELTKTIMGLLDLNGATVKIPEQALLRTFGDGAISQLDEFSSLIWPDEVARFNRTTQGRFIGVGVQIQLDEGRNLKVVTPLEGTPAQRAGIKKDDLIRKVDGESTLGISLLQAVDKITGPAGTKVTLSIERPGTDGLLDFELARAEIPLYTVKGWRREGAHETDWDWFIDPRNRIGYVRLTQFTEDTTAHFDKAVKEMKAKGLSALILDLRGNPGGLLTQAVSISNRFVNDGVIVSQHDMNGAMIDSQSARRGAATLNDIPVAVLINDGSASASEIVSGCLQDYTRKGEVDAVLVGVRSFGKGSVQNIYDLSRGSALFKLTERYYYLPGGRLIHRREGAHSWGVEPDVVVEMLPKQVGDAITLRQDADLLAFDQQGNVVNNDTRPDPSKLLSEGIDPQLEAALLLLRTQTLSRTAGQAMLPPAAAVGGG